MAAWAARRVDSSKAPRRTTKPAGSSGAATGPSWSICIRWYVVPVVKSWPDNWARSTSSALYANTSAVTSAWPHSRPISAARCSVRSTSQPATSGSCDATSTSSNCRSPKAERGRIPSQPPIRGLHKPAVGRRIEARPADAVRDLLQRRVGEPDHAFVVGREHREQCLGISRLRRTNGVTVRQYSNGFHNSPCACPRPTGRAQPVRWVWVLTRLTIGTSWRGRRSRLCCRRRCLRGR